MTPDIRIALVPDMSVTSLALAAMRPDDSGLPAPLRLRLLAAIRSRTVRDALRPILATATPTARRIPGAIAPVIPSGDLALEVQVDALRANHGNRLRDDLTEMYRGDDLPRAWEPAAEHPARWSNAIADLTVDVWQTINDAWRRARPMIDHEFRRVGIALARDDAHGVLNSLSQRISYADGTIEIDHRRHLPLGNRRILLAPMLSTPGSIIIERDDPDTVVVGYAMPGAMQVWHSGPRAPSSADPLATIIGPTRAALLRHLGRPTTMGALAATLNYVPSTITHHCNALESARLIERTRHGKTVTVSRTARGAELVELLS